MTTIISNRDLGDEKPETPGVPCFGCMHQTDAPKWVARCQHPHAMPCLMRGKDHYHCTSCWSRLELRLVPA